MGVDLNKPYRTRGGHVAAVFGHMPDGKIVGWAQDINGSFDAYSWSPGGACTKEGRCDLDLVNVPEKRFSKVWLNVYNTTIGGHFTRDDAERSAARDRIACIEREITYEVGEGL